jgi:hypothetical protein
MNSTIHARKSAHSVRKINPNPPICRGVSSLYLGFIPAGARLTATCDPNAQRAVERQICLANRVHQDRNGSRSQVRAVPTQTQTPPQHRPRPVQSVGAEALRLVRRPAREAVEGQTCLATESNRDRNGSHSQVRAVRKQNQTRSAYLQTCPKQDRFYGLESLWQQASVVVNPRSTGVKPSGGGPYPRRKPIGLLADVSEARSVLRPSNPCPLMIIDWVMSFQPQSLRTDGTSHVGGDSLPTSIFPAPASTIPLVRKF